MIDEIVGVGDEADVYRPENLVEVGVEAVAAEQRLGVGRKLLHLPPTVEIRQVIVLEKARGVHYAR